MELKNIHNRKDFLKINEVFGATGGGVGSNDGFASTGKLKDSLLGKLFNGIFKGIGWLWRKSKENFIINRLIAQLINELMRGTILFCLDNDINLRSGQMFSGSTIKSSDDNESNFIQDDSLSGTTTGQTQAKEPIMSREELIKKIEILKKDIIEDRNAVKSKESNIQQNERNLNDNPPKTQAERLKKQQFIDSQKSELQKRREGLKISQEELIKLEEQLKKLGNPEVAPAKISFEKLEKACKEKYQFVATSDDPGVDAMSLGAVAYPEFVKNFQERFKTKFIKIGDKFTIIRQGILTSIETYDVDTVKGTISYYYDKKLETVSATKLLSNGFPSFKGAKEQAEAFLKNHINEYDNMNDEEKKRIEIVYMNYAIINAMREVQRSAIAENFQYLIEEGATVEIKPEEPRAGQVSVAKGVSQNLGVSVTVGDILTVRDKNKFKDDKGEEFKVKINDVNLAEIEKTIQKLDEGIDDSDITKYKLSKEKYGDINIRKKVSTYVNPYNLKMIQGSAEKLMLPTKGEGSNDNKEALRLRWNKEVNKVYAGFTNIMDIQSVDITKDDFGSKLNNDKVNQKIEKNVSNISFEKNVAVVQEKLPIEQNEAILSSLAGAWSFYSFSYNNYNFMTSIAPVKPTSSDFYLFMVTKAFTDVDASNFTIVDDESLKIFKGRMSDNVAINFKQINIYFLMNKNTKFPSGSSKSQTNKVIVFNHIFFKDGKKGFFICKPNEKFNNITITDDLIKNMDIKNYLTTVSTKSCHKFIDPDINNWTQSLNLSNNSNELNFCSFDHNVPGFLDDKMKDNLKLITSKM